MTTIHPFADNAEDATPQKRAEEMKSLSLLQRTLPQAAERASAPFPKFVIRRSTLCHELRKQRGTSKRMILVPPFDLKFLAEFAALV